MHDYTKNTHILMTQLFPAITCLKLPNENGKNQIFIRMLYMAPDITEIPHLHISNIHIL